MKKLFILILLFVNTLIANETKIELTTTYDEFQDVTWIEPNFDNYEGYPIIYAYIGHQNEEYWLRLVAQYKSSDWIFFEQLILLHNGIRKVIKFNYSQKTSKVVSGGIYEAIDIQVDADLLEYLEEYSLSTNSKLRFYGDKYYADRDIGEFELQALQVVINKYKELKKWLWENYL